MLSLMPVRSRLRVWIAGAAIALLGALGAMPAAHAQNFLLRNGDISAIGTAAASKISPDLRREMLSTVSPTVRWWRWDSGRKLMRVVVLSNSTDPQLTELRQAVLAAGGSVFMRYVTVRGLSVMLPETGVLALA